ncbi:hypothetical protein [Novosphingobium sp.]|uniref:hypothetical protein n=1 Tax=Novosphingobium sp. TaxID=1874826 RepID=UPI00260B3477|nr:hypothetical protein [Novosphingobium sp.]
MNFLSTLSDALEASSSLPAELPEAVQAALLDASAKVSPVDKLVEIAEVLYAARAELDEDALVIAGQVIEFCTRNGWHGLTNDDRGDRMVAAIRRQLGEPHPTGGEWPDPETDPAVKGAPVEQPVTPLPTPAA